MRRFLAYVLAVLVALPVIGYGAYILSPWPSVLLVRYAFDKDSAARNAALDKHVPPGITDVRDERYGPAERMRLDVFHPAGGSGTALPTVVWIHGGAFIAGQKEDLTPYLKILAARGYTVVGVGYTTAPTAQYPTPTLEANEALKFLAANAARFRIDTTRLFLAGDSAGGQIASQLAAAISEPNYAAAIGFTPSIARDQLKGVVLFCGVYDTAKMSLTGSFGGFLRTVLWAYFGTKTLGDNPRLEQFSVPQHVTPKFPPAFVSAGNADPLGPQSVAMADAIRQQGVAIDTLFFAADHKPPLGHEYQFNLDQDAGRDALARLVAFLNKYKS
jgi:acetyl esterase/lipase